MLRQDLPELTPREVRTFRKLLGLDQETFAEVLCVSVSSVEKWERYGARGQYRYVFAAINAGLGPWRSEDPAVSSL